MWVTYKKRLDIQEAVIVNSIHAILQMMVYEAMKYQAVINMNVLTSTFHIFNVLLMNEWMNVTPLAIIINHRYITYLKIKRTSLHFILVTPEPAFEFSY